LTASEISDEEFHAEVMLSDRTVIVDFWAAWCQPCRQISTVLSEIAQDYPNVKVVQINTDQNPRTTTGYSVSSVPTVIVFQNGEAVRSIIGARSKSGLLRELSEYLS
jgi:thioredoxin 1